MQDSSSSSRAILALGYAYVDVAGRDTGSYMNDAQKIVGAMVKLPAGYRLEWSGSFEGMQRAGRQLMYVIPITLAVIFLLLYLNARSLAKALIVMMAVPFSLVGAFLLLWLLGYHLSVAVWVGIIALAGVDAETGSCIWMWRRAQRAAMRCSGLVVVEVGLKGGSASRWRAKPMPRSRADFRTSANASSRSVASVLRARERRAASKRMVTWRRGWRRARAAR
jgi:Cu/Ag efflux pump CusA